MVVADRALFHQRYSIIFEGEKEKKESVRGEHHWGIDISINYTIDKHRIADKHQWMYDSIVCNACECVNVSLFVGNGLTLPIGFCVWSTPCINS